MSAPPALTREERFGAAIVLAIALAILLPQLFLVASVALRGYFPGTILIRLGIAATISWCLFRGYDWARRWVPIVFLLDAVAGVLMLIQGRAWAPAFTLLPIDALRLAAAIVLWRSESVDAFLRRQSAGRRAVLSIRDEPPA